MRDRNLGLFYCLPGVVLALAIAGCGGGGSSPGPSGPVTSAPATSTPIAHATATPSPVGAPTPTSVPTAAATTQPLVAGSPVAAPPVGGYSAVLTFTPPAGSSFPAGIDITTQNLIGLPGGVGVVQARRHSFVSTSPDIIASTEFSFNESTTLFYSIMVTIPSVVPGASYTAVTFNATTSTLIASIVSTATSGGSATFTDPTPFAVVANQEYVTEIFLTPAAATATPSAAPTVTPVPTATPSSPPLQLFAANSPGGGVAEYNGANGSLTRTFATSLTVGAVGADDAGNIYTFGGSGSTSEISQLAVGGNTPLASYSPTSTRPVSMSVAPDGEMIVLGISGSNAVFDEWDAGKNGAPSRTITYGESHGTEATFAQDADGNLYVPYKTSGGVQKFDVIRAGTTTLLRTLTETLASNLSSFSPNVMAATTDGTLYVGEWNFSGSDSNAAMYVFAPSGAESKVSSMDPGIVGIDFDGSGNVYVACNNAQLPGSTSQSDDTAEQLTAYSARGAALIQQISDGVPGVGALTIGDDGTAYLVQFASFGANAPMSAGAIYTVAPGATTSSDIVANVNTQNVVLYETGTAKDLRMARVHHASFGNPANMGKILFQK